MLGAAIPAIPVIPEIPGFGHTFMNLAPKQLPKSLPCSCKQQPEAFSKSSS